MSTSGLTLDARTEAQARADVQARKEARAKVRARCMGWEHHGDDAHGIWWHRSTWGSWKAAVSWSGTDNEPNHADARPAIYDDVLTLIEQEGL